LSAVSLHWNCAKSI